MAKNDKTNVMRILDQAKIPYSHYTYEHREGEAVDGLTVAASMNQPPERVFKTLVTRGAGRDFFVFVIPVACELDLKAAAHAVGEKSVEMIHVAEINKVTGYIRGGCSPLAGKKHYPVFVDESAILHERIYVSAGHRGVQLRLAPDDLLRAVEGTYAAIARY